MKVYLVILEDRHTAIQVEVFASQEQAIARAEAIVSDYAPDADIEELCAKLPARWLFHKTLTTEGDTVYVEIAELQNGPPSSGS